MTEDDRRRLEEKARANYRAAISGMPASRPSGGARATISEIRVERLA